MALSDVVGTFFHGEGPPSQGPSQLITNCHKNVSHNFPTHLIVGLVNNSHSPELLVTLQVSPLKLKWLLTPGQDSRDDICGIAIGR